MDCIFDRPWLLLPMQELRVSACCNREAVDAEQAKNRKLGEELHCWKAGVLVENDNGDVAKALDALAKR